MDPVSITAGVVGVTAACLKTAKILNELRPRYLEASATIAAICSESTLVSASLSQVQALLLRNSKVMATQLQARPELAATFDTTLTGCTVVFACLEEEVNRLDIKACKEEDQDSWKHRAKIAWRADTMKELLQSIRGQQGAITLLIQMLQMESLSDIHRLIQDNTAVLRGVVHRTRSLRSSNPRVGSSIPESFLGRKDTESILCGDNASSIGGTEFEFDDIVVNSKAYRRALESLRRKETSIAINEDEEKSVPTDFPEPDAALSPLQGASPSLIKFEHLKLHSANSSASESSEIPSETSSPTSSLRRRPHIRQKSSGLSYSSINNDKESSRVDYWSTIPDLKLNHKVIDVSPSKIPFPDVDSISISSHVSSLQSTSEATQTQPPVDASLDHQNRSSVGSSIYPTKLEDPFTDPKPNVTRPNCYMCCQYDDGCPVKLVPGGVKEHFKHHLTLERDRQQILNANANAASRLAGSREIEKQINLPRVSGSRPKPLINSTANKSSTPARQALKQSSDKVQTLVKQNFFKKKKVSLQLSDDEKAAIEKRFQEERKILEKRRKAWDRRRRQSADVKKLTLPSNPSQNLAVPANIRHKRSSSAQPTYVSPIQRPVATKKASRIGVEGRGRKMSQLRGSDLPPPRAGDGSDCTSCAECLCA
ncbi:hypothetical protein K469DRAFT_637902 [Zopfia rhizophila CBS 207.26]|uniref:Fungal N-terminal domain-containing protein n=1 Tax=Zopfia rhizophila CBS 207.26 TaxID=1314779 RepID=A0A6A6DQ96_9PEZI|nr:hypothetical protein K469DRAFT_637902 [Zopfia rhizophila CBS 207.26]